MGTRERFDLGPCLFHALAVAVVSLVVSSPLAADEAGDTTDSKVEVSQGDVIPAPAALWAYRDPELQLALEVAMAEAKLAPALARRALSVALVDMSDPRRPRVAAINGDRLFYAASLPKIAILLAVYEKAATGQLTIDEETRRQLYRMIRVSSNADSTALMKKVGKPYIADVLRSPRYRLYDETRNGGLWAGKDYASGGLWQRDPIRGLSHAATAMQAARFFYLLERGQLVSAEASLEMKQILRHDNPGMKFLEGIRRVEPRARIYRKGGTWRNFHADAALVERDDGAVFVAAALSESDHGREWLADIAASVNGLIAAPEG